MHRHITGSMTCCWHLLTITEFRQQSSRNLSHNVTPAASKPSSNDNDSMRPNVGEDIRSGSPQGPNHDPASIHDSARKIDDLAKLTLSQENIPDESSNGPKAPSLPYTNPLKRGVADGSGQCDRVAEGKSDSPRPRARRAKAQSGGPYPSQTSDHSPDHPVTSDSRVTRTSLGSGKRLFDPTLDSPMSNTTRTNHNPDNAVTSRHFDESRAHAIRSRKMIPTNLEEPANVNFIQGNRIQQRPVKIMRPHHGSATLDIDQFSTKEEAAPTAAAQEDEWMPDQEYDPEPVLLLQPETRPISHDQLVVEVKGIYAGLVLVESKCIDVDQKQSKAAQEKDPARQTKLTNEQWQALIHLHKTLLHEHHDFFLASQHPSASPALSKLAAKYSMPARMWHHGIHAFLEVLRHRLPESLDHMLAFIYIAYSMMALLYETVSTFEDTWIECLGDLGRYRMAIEDDDQRDRDVWSCVSRFWYSKAADKCPDTGRLYHHLAILARPYTLQQLSFYTRSLTCMNPFGSARSSIMTLFSPILNGKESAYHRSASMETIFIKAHATLFCNRPADEFEAAVHQLEKDGLDNYVGRVTSKFKEQGVFAMVANISALFEYGAVGQTGISRAIFRIAYDEIIRRKRDEVRLASPDGNNKLLDANDFQHRSGQSSGQTNAHQTQLSVEDLTPSELEVSRNTIGCAARLTFSTLSICLQRVGDKNVWPLVHVSFVFLWSLTFVDKAMKYVQRDIPWSGICSFLNNLAKPEAMTARIWANDFPQTDGKPLPEDFQIRGQLYSQWYFRDKWFENTMVDDEERTLELPSMTALRVERILWLGMRIATVCSLPSNHCTTLMY